MPMDKSDSVRRPTFHRFWCCEAIRIAMDWPHLHSTSSKVSMMTNGALLALVVFFAASAGTAFAENTQKKEGRSPL